MARYKIVESVGNHVENVGSFEDLEKHHPSSGREPNREYETINRKLEEVRHEGGVTYVKKDFVLQVNGSDNVQIPSPATGYVHHLNDGTNAIRIYDKPFGTPGAQFLGQVLHTERGTNPPEGAKIEYGKPIGQQGDTGTPGAVHAHVELPVAQFKQYIADISSGRIQTDGVVTATQPVNTPSDSGTLKDKLLEKGEDGPGVKRLQEALNAAGVKVNGQPLPTTGHFGDMTEQAVKTYQQQKNLEPDGRAGKDTLTALGINPGQQQAPAQTPTQPTQTPTPQPSNNTAAPTQTPAPTPTQQTNPYGFGADNELGKLIARGESGKDAYNSYNRGNAGDTGKPINLTELTVGEVMRRQELSKNDPNYLFAVGKYQFVDTTLKETVEKLGIDKNAKFSPQLQEKMFADYLIDEKRPAVRDYITGKTNGPQGLERAQHALALEFASVGDPRNGGRSAYDGLAGNSASIKPSEVTTALDHMREQYQKNIQSGQNPEQAYRALSGDPNKYSQNAGAQTQPSGQGGLDDKLLLKGEDGAGVKRLQEALNAAGIKVNGQPLPTTGHFGDMTEQAVKTYQQQKGLEPDGKAGKDTLSALGIYPGQQQTAPKPEAQQPAQPAPKPEAQQPAQPAPKPEAQPPATQPTQQAPTQQTPAQPAEKPANPTQPATPAQPAATAGPSVAALQAEGVLTVGAKGADVTALQQRLQDVGLLDKKGVTGTFDETTRQAVMKLEQQAGLSQQPGIYGPKSEQALGKLEQSLVTSEKFADPKAHKLYEQTLELTKTLPAGTFKDEAEQKRAAAAITMELYAAGKTDPQSMALDKKSGTMVFVFESKDPSKDQSVAARTPEPVNMSAAKEMPLSVSSGLIADMGQKQAPQAQTPQTPDVAKPAQANPVQADPQQEPQKPKVMLA